MWILASVTLAVAVLTLAFVVFLLLRSRPAEWIAAAERAGERGERSVREEFARNRDESSLAGRQVREELSASVQNFAELVLARIAEFTQLQQAHLEAFATRLDALAQGNEDRLGAIRASVGTHLGELRTDAAEQHRAGREELARSMKTLGDSLLTRMTELATLQKQQLDLFAQNLGRLSTTTEQRLDAMRETVERKLGDVQRDSAEKLEKIRATVDEKLHATLEQRLGESFKLVSERLEQVHSGLGEMRTLATGVGDLKKVLTNIKTRGTWGEVQLGTLLEQMLTPEQFARNVAPSPRSNERVEFAVKLPGRDDDGACVWLPIDSKFPQEEYQRLGEAQDRGDVEGVETATRAFEVQVKAEARKIREKYLHPPHTTDFGIMFLPTEGLFAEVLRRPGLADAIQRDHRVVVSGPTTLAALLSSLQMGFRTLAIEKRSSEVWNVLGAVKTEFGKFGEALEKVKKKLSEASSSIEAAETRHRVVSGKLRKAEALPAAEAAQVLGLEGLVGEAPAGGEDEGKD